MARLQDFAIVSGIILACSLAGASILILIGAL